MKKHLLLAQTTCQPSFGPVFLIVAAVVGVGGQWTRLDVHGNSRGQVAVVVRCQNLSSSSGSSATESQQTMTKLFAKAFL
jgi:hypothetical protein